jgi:hypothetical protein
LLHGSIREVVRLEMKVKSLEARCLDLERQDGGRP